jgi:hypothetical protein
VSVPDPGPFGAACRLPVAGPRCSSPAAGEHTVEVLRDLVGYEPAQIDARLDGGVIA